MFCLLCPGFINCKYGDLSICTHERRFFFLGGGGGVVWSVSLFVFKPASSSLSIPIAIKGQ